MLWIEVLDIQGFVTGEEQLERVPLTEHHELGASGLGGHVEGGNRPVLVVKEIDRAVWVRQVSQGVYRPLRPCEDVHRQAPGVPNNDLSRLNENWSDVTRRRGRIEVRSSRSNLVAALIRLKEIRRLGNEKQAESDARPSAPHILKRVVAERERAATWRLLWIKPPNLGKRLGVKGENCRHLTKELRLWRLRIAMPGPAPEPQLRTRVSVQRLLRRHSPRACRAVSTCCPAASL